MNGKANVNRTVEQLQANCDYIGTYKKLIEGGECMQVKGQLVIGRPLNVRWRELRAIMFPLE